MDLFEIISILQGNAEKFRSEAEIMGERNPNYLYWKGRQEAYEDAVDMLVHSQEDVQV